MPQPEILLKTSRGDRHLLSLKRGALRFFALGSSGWRSDRLDAYSDLDFFAIVARGLTSGHRRNRVAAAGPPYRFYFWQHEGRDN